MFNKLHDDIQEKSVGIISYKEAFYGHIDCLTFAWELGVPYWVNEFHQIFWISSACSLAAMGGHLDCLKYLHENGCPWNDSSDLTQEKDTEYPHKRFFIFEEISNDRKGCRTWSPELFDVFT